MLGALRALAPVEDQKAAEDHAEELAGTPNHEAALTSEDALFTVLG